MSRKSSGLQPIGPIFDSIVIALARRTGRLPRYYPASGARKTHLEAHYGRGAKSPAHADEAA